MLKEKITSIEWRTKAFPRLILLCSLFAVLVFWNMVDYNRKPPVKAPSKPNPFAEIEVSAKAAMVWEVNNQKVIYSKNETLPLPLASLTKVMTAVTAEVTAEDMDTVSIQRDDLSPEGDTGLKVDSRWNTHKLIDYLLVTSSNDGARALAGAAGAWHLDLGTDEKRYSGFVDNMNLIARQIGLTNSVFYNEHGLDKEDGKAGAYGSAKDMTKLFEYVLYHYPHMLEATKYRAITVSDLNNENYSASNTNVIINQIPSPIASKTGYTELAGGNLVTVFDTGVGEPVIIVILGSTQDGRFDDMLKLVNTTQAYISN